MKNETHVILQLVIMTVLIAILISVMILTFWTSNSTNFNNSEATLPSFSIDNFTDSADLETAPPAFATVVPTDFGNLK